MIRPIETCEALRTAFLSSAVVRRNILLFLLVVAVFVASVSAAILREIEGRDQLSRLNAMAEHPGTIDLLSGSLPQGITKIGERRVAVEKAGGIHVVMAEVSVTCSFSVLRAVNEAGNVLQRQWDFRYVRSGDPGAYWFVTYISPNMGYTSTFYVELLGVPDCVSVNKWLLIPLKNTQTWPYLLYNDSFAIEGDAALPMLTNGYKTMPINQDLLPLPSR